MPNVPPSGGGAPTSLDAGHWPVQPFQEGLAGHPQAVSLASQGVRGNANRLDISPRDKSSLRLCNQVPSRFQRATGVLRNSGALPQDRLRPGAATGDLRRSLVNLLPSTEEGHRQDARLCGSPQAQQSHSVRALQDGGAAHSSAAHPPQRLHDEDRPKRLLHALPHRQGRPQVHAVHVGGQKVSVCRHAIRPSSGPSASYQDDGPGHSIPSVMRPSVGDLYRRPHPTVPILQGVDRAHSTTGGYPTQPRLRHSPRQVFSDPLPIGRILRHTGEQQAYCSSGYLETRFGRPAERSARSSPKTRSASLQYGNFALYSAS